MLIGGGLVWLALGAQACENSSVGGSDPYCNGGGWELSGLGAAIAIVAALALTGLALARRRYRLFTPALAASFCLVPADLAFWLFVAR
jgi:hypothetical protein